jgi:tripartite-type tricarboxylate transporter receptor subunit TctC
MGNVFFEKICMRKGKAWRSVAGMILISCVLMMPGATLAQEKYPLKPINFYVGFPPGGSADICTRPLASAASKILGQPIVIVNKPGSAGAVVASLLKSDKPDGYTVGLLSTGAVLNQQLRKVSYDTRRDFTPIMQYAGNQYGLVVRADSPWKTFKEFIDYAKANPEKIRYSTSGVGNAHHLVMEQLAIKEKIKWAHIPFDGAATAVSALLGKHVEACSQTPIWRKHVEDGRLRLLAVYQEKRMESFPQTPTLMELGYNIKAFTLLSVAGPKGLSPKVVEILNGAFKKALKDPDFIKVQDQLDQIEIYRDPQELAKYLVEMNEEVGALIRMLGLNK